MATTYTLYSTKSSFPSDKEGPKQAIMEFKVEQDIENNFSTINWTLKAGGEDTTQSLRWYCIEFYYTLSPNSDPINLYAHREEQYISSKQVIATGSFRVDHNFDGTKTIYIYFAGYTWGERIFADYQASDAMVTGADELWPGKLVPQSLVLPEIPRTSTVSATTVEIGRNPTISINSPSTSYTHGLRYKFGNLSGTIVERTALRAYTLWSIPTSFLNEISGKYGEGTIYCDTYKGNTFHGTTETKFRVNVPSLYGPTIDASIENIDPTTLALTGNDPNKIIQYFNTIGYNIGAFTSTGATITGVSIACGSQSASTMTGTLTNVDSNVFTVTATDSRGFTTTETIYKDMVPYIKLTTKLQLVSIDTDGFGSVAISGNLFRGSFGIVENNPVISYRWKEEGGTWSNWTSVVYNIYNDSYYAEVEFYGLDYRKTYLYEAKATDRLMTVQTEQLVVKCMPVFDWSGDDFQFNVPVTVTGDLVVTGNVTSANNPVAMDDFIVEQGTKTTGSGNSQANWVYRKWNSGIAECWCRKHISTAVNTAWGNLYVSGALSYTNITWGVTFTEIPVANITIAPNATGAFLIAGGSTSLTATNTGGYEIARGSALSSAGSFYINYYAIGKWK